VQRAQHGVLVHAEYRGEVLGQREPFAGFRLTVGDRPADLSRDLLVQKLRNGPVDLDVRDGPSQSSSMIRRRPDGEKQ